MTHPQMFQRLLVYCGCKINWAAAYWVALCKYLKIRMLSITLPWLYSTLLNSTWLLRWVKASSECIDRDTEVCKGITINRGRFVTIYGYWMAAMWRLLTFASSVMTLSLYCIGFSYQWLWLRSNSQQGYGWTKSFVFLEARNRKMARTRSFSSWPQQPDPPTRCQIWENSVCNTGK